MKYIKREAVVDALQHNEHNRKFLSEWAEGFDLSDVPVGHWLLKSERGAPVTVLSPEEFAANYIPVPLRDGGRAP